jgi:hypothetical protein
MNQGARRPIQIRPFPSLTPQQQQQQMARLNMQMKLTGTSGLNGATIPHVVMQNVQNSQAVQNVQNNSNVQNMQSLHNIQNSQSVQNAQPIGTYQPPSIVSLSLMNQYAVDNQDEPHDKKMVQQHGKKGAARRKSSSITLTNTHASQEVQESWPQDIKINDYFAQPQQLVFPPNTPTTNFN